MAVRERGGDGLSRRAFVRGTLGVGALGGAASASATGEASAQAGSETVDMTDELVFDPEELSVAPGTTVTWENVGTVGHSVTAYEDEIPPAATYFASGGFEGEEAARDAYPEGDVPGGERYEYTFEVEGVYDYFCIPHESVGMVATVEVTAGGGGGDEEEGVIPGVPNAARTIGLALAALVAGFVGLAYFFLKYGDDYEGE
ncbi:plastocyanin/azurin family copper-binding protein [Halomarina ordinaria]|uniref:Plastocyanin/azurin family copper-binding protein n=1 Tax=Halomarina ordinaria TaxID=3033939 RepID=A0ABD5UCH8_9EURY|nr:plastocyanin/azurin family copper-binding protein [Halomarina sp. PSRA2]